ncbi:group 10 secretory phospholipase A2-like [Bufo bufo]|uniref:group 10 secretory phospholipase A2-like n=1 Tax=Bufo bufo TaxID=8384 RepID=UPI001ABE86F9|nr:group 10 secretory phospholipase A2-like [Bufo bufo]
MSLNGEQGDSRIRQKKSVIELAGAIECGTGGSALYYLGYGCYCGVGGHGMPLDETDWCCFNHDCCYGNAENAGCHPKIDLYEWECIDNSIKCASAVAETTEAASAAAPNFPGCRF